MKLDLVNSRLKYEQGPRIFDSIEGDLIQAPPVSPQAISKVSFLSKQHRLDYSPKTEPIPDRFNNSVVDRCGSYLPINKSPKHRIPSKTVHHKANTDEFLLDEFPSEIVDLMKDHIYKIKEETVQRRLESGKLPGGVWDTVGRKSTPPAYNIGPGDYEVYSSDITYRGRSSIKGGQFKTQPSGREHDEEIDPNYLPLKERKRYLRMMAAQQAKIESASRLRSSSSPPRPKGSIGTLSALSIGDTADENGEGSASLAGSPINIKSKSLGSSSLRGRGTKERFDDRIYKQESFVKTSGMTLSADWDKKLIKKIPFSFQPPEHSKKSFHKTVNKSEGADVDVDVGHFYSIVRTAQLSPVKYSAAFK